MRTRWTSLLTAAAILVIVTMIAYSGVFSCEFVSFDDPFYVYNNIPVRAGISWSGCWYAFTTWDCSNWHPLTWLSLELDSTCWGGNPGGFHATNLVLHALNVVLVLFSFYQMTGCLVRSICVAALFALHPLHVESVAWVSERKDVLSTFFLLWTVIAYLWYAKRPSYFRYAIVFVLFAIGLLAKPMLVTMPILLLLLDGWPLNRFSWITESAVVDGFSRRSPARLLLEKLPILGLAVVDGLMTVIAQRSATKLLSDLPITVRLANSFHAVFWYLSKTFCPTNLAVFYPHPEHRLSWTLVSCGIIAVVLISAMCLWSIRTKPYRIVGWAWFIISLLPVIGLLQVGGQAYADRYTYVPHLGLFMMIVWEIDSWLEGTKLGRVYFGVVAVTTLMACGVLTHSQVSYWKNNRTLWTHAIDVVPANAVAHFHFADLLQSEADYEQAIEHIAAGLRIKPDANGGNAHYNWGRCLVALNRLDEAKLHFLESLKFEKNNEPALDELTKVLRKQGRHAEAAQVAAQHAIVLSQIIKERPDNAKMQLNLGLMLARNGQVADAIPHFEKAIQNDPQYAAAYNNLALALSQLNRTAAAKKNFRRALELNPNLAVAHFNLAAILENERDFQGAKEHFGEALRLDPNDAEAAQRLKNLMGQQ